jgi:lipoprotein-anchoring transpeptidase ErfK/SrfK
VSIALRSPDSIFLPKDLPMRISADRRRASVASKFFIAASAAFTLLSLSAPAEAARAHRAQRADDGTVALPVQGEIQPGTIVIRARERALYYVLDSGRAIRYPIAVPRYGKEWSGVARINGKFANPDWAAPAVVRRDNPNLPAVIPGGAPNNPMGVAALTLDRDEIAIHGTSSKMRRSIGSAASYGCIRMYNEDVTDLFQRVSVGTPVVMIQ